MTKQILHNKLALFKAAGYDCETGWDTAIPQAWFDELLKMCGGMPIQWWVADCKTFCTLPVLHHIGEALFDILTARAKANEEILDQCLAANFESDEQGTAAEMLWKFIAKQRELNDDAGAGFTHLNFITSAWMDGYNRGKEAALKEAADNAKALVNETSWVVVDTKVEVGQSCPILGRFPTEELGSKFIETLPEYLTGRYGLDESNE